MKPETLYEIAIERWLRDNGAQSFVDMARQTYAAGRADVSGLCSQFAMNEKDDALRLALDAMTRCGRQTNDFELEYPNPRMFLAISACRKALQKRDT